MHLEYWPEAIIELNRELASGLHKDLEQQLKGVDDFVERFSIIAAYCEVALDGMYTSDQMVAMVEMFFIPRLVKKRKRPDDGKPEIIREL